MRFAGMIAFASRTALGFLNCVNFLPRLQIVKKEILFGVRRSQVSASV